MQRRHVLGLAAAGMVAPLSGCLTAAGLGSGDEDDSQLEEYALCSLSVHNHLEEAITVDLLIETDEDAVFDESLSLDEKEPYKQGYRIDSRVFEDQGLDTPAHYEIHASVREADREVTVTGETIQEKRNLADDWFFDDDSQALKLHIGGIHENDAILPELTVCDRS